MIDFRYHLISIVAVFLALGIGILLGTSLAEPLAEDIEKRLNSAEGTNAKLQELIDELNDRIGAGEQFAEAARDHLVSGALSGQRVVLVTFDGTDGTFISTTENSIDEAGGQVVTRIRLTAAMGLKEGSEAAELTEITGTDATEPDDVRAAALTLLGRRAAKSASGVPSRARDAEIAELDDFVSALEDAGFVEVETGDGAVVPEGAEFILLAGGEKRPDYDIASAQIALAAALSDEGVPVLAAEPENSVWRVVDALRGAADVAATVVTVDSANSVTGQIALVFGLDCADEGVVGHYGRGEGTEPLPNPVAGC